MPAYVVALIQSISDAETYKRYVEQVEPTLRPFGGRFLARKPSPEALEGTFAPSRCIVLEFPSEERARAWHASPPYQPVMRLRQSASTGTLLLLPAYSPSEPRVALNEVHYVEMVSSDPAATQRLCEATFGWRFAQPDETLGGARVATLPGAARCAIRAPLGQHEKPLTRAYVRVQDVDEAAARAGKHGALVALPPTPVGDHGRIAIWIHGGVEHGAWELPSA